VSERSAETFEEIEIGPEGVDLTSGALRRPSATWTYMVHDNPFDTDAEQALQRVRAMIKKVKGGARR
jgi:preprotein translocase subunit SecA